MQFFRSSLTVVPSVAKKHIAFAWVPRNLELHGPADWYK